MSKQAVQLTLQNFEAFTDKGGLVVFSSRSCPPCRAMKPEVYKYAALGHNVGIVELDDDTMPLFSAFKISSLPQVYAIKGSTIRGHLVGASKTRLADLLKLAQDAGLVK